MNHIIVTEASKNMRAMAREALAGKWQIAAVATLVYLVAIMLPTTILNIFFGGELGYSGLSSLYTLLVTGPFTVGYSMFCLNLFRNQEIEVAQVFYGFERFGKAFGLCFMMGLFVFLWSLLLVIPGIIAAYRYSQAFLIMIDHPEYGIMQCLAESKRLMTGNKMKYFCMELSFIGWVLLAIIPTMILNGIVSVVYPYAMAGVTGEIVSYIGMIGFIWLQPYMSVAGVAFYELANGNLRPGIIEGNATIVEDNRQYTAETFIEENKENLDSGNNDQL
ncbi:DUF975 family protein [Clostridium aminobutyricum]|uniref:DUF975 family protein n=1 Tax=Clostridium aminobutyricum TaxID=33953 RepID=A0A939D6T2_CLOAM|nr:DUF975 family protein [Clostridium aminobutyricum]MBN7772170.1 DUF975 family protein [Clostridium aminobutyricum]